LSLSAAVILPDFLPLAPPRLLAPQHISHPIYNYCMYDENNEIVLNIETDIIQATNRKLKAVWSRETQEDLRSQFNLDAEAELTRVLANEINAEIDKEILEDLRAAQPTVRSVFPSTKGILDDLRKTAKDKKKKRICRSITDDWTPTME
jgi:hypothetical protein